MTFTTTFYTFSGFCPWASQSRPRHSAGWSTFVPTCPGCKDPQLGPEGTGDSSVQFHNINGCCEPTPTLLLMNACHLEGEIWENVSKLTARHEPISWDLQPLKEKSALLAMKPTVDGGNPKQAPWTLDVKPINNGINYLSTGAGLQSSPTFSCVLSSPVVLSITRACSSIF